MSVQVTRHDFVRRSRVVCKCTKCGTTTMHVPIAEADMFEAGFREHVCGTAPIPPESLALRRMLAALVDDSDDIVLDPR